MRHLLYSTDLKRTKPPLGAQINRAHPLAQGLIFYALFNEGSGEASTLVPYGKVGTTVGTFTGWKGYEYGLSRNWYYAGAGAGGGVQGVYWPGVLASQPAVITVAFSAYPLAHNGSYGENVFTTGPMNFDFYSNTQISYAVVMQVQGSKSGSYVFSSPPSDGSQFAGSFFQQPGGSAADLRLWYNGLRVKDDTFGSGYNSMDWTASPTTDVLIGASSETNPPTGGSGMDGLIYWVAVWNYALSDAYVAWLYQDPYAMLLGPEIQPTLLGGIVRPLGGLFISQPPIIIQTW
jgi:hypothetical protein